jgi:uncharacterized membrane protein YidH (DUF202 family)
MEFMVAVLVFTGVICVGLLVLQPFFTQYVDTYAVRVRSKKEKADSAAEAPKDSALLGLCKTAGELVLSVMPALADKRTGELLQQANYRTQEHLAIYMGIKTIVVGSCIFFCLITAAGNPINILFSVPLALMGWIVPNFFLSSRVKARSLANCRPSSTC